MLNKITTPEKINYGIGSIAYSLPYTLLGGVFLIYATVILKIPPLYAGIIVAISALWDAVSDPLMGYLSDKTRSITFGKRHLYILLGSALTAIFTWLFWSIDPAQTMLSKITSLTLYVLALKTTLTIFVIPYNALGGELASEYDDRSSIQSWRAGFYIFGMILSLAISNIIFFRPTEEFAKGQLNPSVYPQIGFTFAIITLIIGLISYFTTRHHIPSLANSSNQQQNYRSFIKNLKNCLKNSNMRNLALMIFTIEVGFQITIANGFHINTYVYNLNGPQIGLLGLILLGSSILSQPFWVAFSKKHDKKPALRVAGVLALIGFTMGPWIIVWWELVPAHSTMAIYILGIFSVFSGFANGAFMSLPFSMISDSIDAAEVETGIREEGMYFGIYTFAYKAGISVSLLFSGLVLHLINFDAELAIQTESTTFYLALVPSWMLVLIVPMAYLFIGRYQINRNNNQEIKMSLKKRPETTMQKIDSSVEATSDFDNKNLDSAVTIKS